MFMMHETNYDKVHVCLANKASFKKNEGDFLNNFALVKDGKKISEATPRQDLVDKVNLVTLKYRPLCNFSGAICGMRWFRCDKGIFSDQAYIPKESGEVREEGVPLEVIEGLKDDFDIET